MYIAIEGIKGSGKSTLVNNLNQHFKEAVVVSPTRIFEDCMLIDKIQKIVTNGTPHSLFKEMLYVFKSNMASITTDWSAPLILGDRSIITSYATRLWRFNQPNKQISLIDILEPLLPPPDIVLYLKPSSITPILDRLKERNREYGKEDETVCKLSNDMKAYEYLMNHPNKRIEKSKWFLLDANMSTYQLKEESIKIINKF